MDWPPRSKPNARATRIVFMSPKADRRSVWLYALAELRPATPFFIPLQSLCDFPGAGPRRISEAFATHPRFVVAGAWERRYNCELESARALIDAALQSDYRRIASIACDDRHCAKGEDYDLYEIIAPAPPETESSVHRLN